MIKITIQSQPGVQANEGVKSISLVAVYLQSLFSAWLAEHTTAATIKDEVCGFDVRIEIAPDHAEGKGA